MFSFVFSYIRWHYTSALRDLFSLIGNFLWFVYHFFSIPILTRTLFRPIETKKVVARRISSSIGALITDIFSRIIGFLLRSLFIMTGLIMLVIIGALGLVISLFWLFMPFVIVIFFISGLRLLLK